MMRCLGLLALAAVACAVSTPIGELPQAATDGATSSASVSTGVLPDSTTTSTTTAPESMTGIASGDTETIGPGPMRAFSLRFGDIPEPGGTASSDVAGESGAIDPDALLVVITTGAASCDDPFGGLPCGGAWRIQFTLPPELQVPGSYSLVDELNGGASETGTEPVDCGFGGGTLEGTAEIEVVDVEGVVGRISGGASVFEFDPNVEFEAVRCP